MKLDVEVREYLELKLLKNGEVIVDEAAAKLLYLIDRYGSIISASKALNISYSSAWNAIGRIERITGLRIIERRRGAGGGAVLTDISKALLEKYVEAYQRIFHRPFTVEKETMAVSEVTVYAGSHDVMVNHLLGLLRRRNYSIEEYWIGSLKGLSSVLLGEADLAGIHILDRETGEYNIPLIKRYRPGTDIVLIRGWMRSIGFASHERMGLDEVMERLVDGELRLVNRNKGSGTRRLLEYLIEEQAWRCEAHPDELRKKIKGYEYEVSTHNEVAEALASGKADVGLTIGCVAEAYKLNYMHLRWENFDLVTRRELLNTRLSELRDTLRSSEFTGLIEKSEWYRTPEDIGVILL